MTLILSILLGLIFVFVIGVIALGIVAYSRDYCDETLPNSPTEGANPPNPPNSPNSPNQPKSAPKRDSHGRFTKKDTKK